MATQLLLIRYIYVLSVFAISTANIQVPQVKISQGILKGRVRTNRDGGTFYSFQSIPYAKPPIGQLRFKAPVPASGWDGIRDATRDLPECSQFDVIRTNFFGQEDCLYLNVYTPELSGAKPVMVFIHGGGFVLGSAQETWYGPEFILTKNVVLVTINYRLGIFGHLNLDVPELEVPGNAAMKDQVLALRWIQNNIKQFGGNSSNVLLFGESAGGSSVHLHILSPMSAGLFHKAIAESGVALADFAGGLKGSGEAIAKQLGIQTENSTSMLASLREVSDRDLIRATLVISQTNQYLTSPIVEVPSNEPAFLLNKPIDIIQSGKYNKVPFITGVNNNEGVLWQYLSKKLTGQDLTITDFTKFVPKDLNIVKGSAQEEQIVNQLKQFYFGDTDAATNNSQALNIYSDFVFIFPAYRSVLEHMKTASVPVYFYLFSVETRLNLLKRIDKIVGNYTGAAHLDELAYLFSSNFSPSDIEQNGIEDLAIKNMVNLWTNFATYGNPTPDNFVDFKWLPVEKKRFRYLSITTNSTYMDVDLLPDNMKLWSDMYNENCE